jgi:hypothetical protein
MKRAFLAVLLLSASLAMAQEAADFANDPHYSLLLQNERVRVFALTLRTGESVFARHHHSFIFFPLQDGEIVMWDEGKSPIQHFQVHKGETSFVYLTPDQQASGVAGGILNDRPPDYRAITVEVLDPYVGWSILSSGYVRATLFLGGAIVADVSLQPGESLPGPDKRDAELVIAVSDLDLKAASGVRIRNSPGDVAWIASANASALTNRGRDPARFIIVEFYPDRPTTPVEQ